MVSLQVRLKYRNSMDEPTEEQLEEIEETEEEDVNPDAPLL